MILLAVEFSSRCRSVALVQSGAGMPGQVLGEVAETGAIPARPLTLVEAVLTQAGLDAAAVEGMLIGLGPGSYTGIRASIALAQGWQLARGSQLTGVSTVECLIVQAQAQGWFGKVSIAIDAHRNEFYLAPYWISAQGYGVRQPLRLASLDEARAQAGLPGELVVGPDANKLSPRAKVLFPLARDLPRCAPVSPKDISGEKLEPIYLRPISFVKAPPARVVPS